MRATVRKWRNGARLAITLFVGTVSFAAQPSQAALDVFELAQLSLEELGNIKVTSVSRKAENLSSAPAAIAVISGEDIRRSGVTTIAEALRMAPGLQVAHANSRQWAISSRGFNDTFSNKLLVLMDGRTLYTSLFSGVFWEEVDTVLEDVDRIEVIRGPGATLWGANAVNGVINITSKNAKDTQGILISGGGGIEERGFGTVRYGGQLASNVYYRVYGKYANHDEFTMIDGGAGVGDSWWSSQGGFRLDWEPSQDNRFTLQGDTYHNEFGTKLFLLSSNPIGLIPRNAHTDANGHNLVGRWTHALSGDSDLTMQVYYDKTDRGFGIGSEERDTADLDLQHRFHLGERQEIVWGAGYRFSADHMTESPDFQMRDPSVDFHLANIFAQDEIELVTDRLHLTLGTKLEHNDFTGFEVQPSGRLSWTPSHRHTVWTAISRAVRTPSRAERGVHMFVDPGSLLPLAPIPVLVSIDGSETFGAEDLIAYELGYRFQVTSRLSLDTAVFYNDYDNLRAQVARPIEFRLEPELHLLFPTELNNTLYGETYGGEIAMTWRLSDAWRFRSGYSFLQLQLHTQGPDPAVTEYEESASPHHQAFLWSDFDLGDSVELGVGLRYVDEMDPQLVPPYLELDARLAWRPNKHCELSIVGRNTLDSHHREFAPDLLTFRRVDVDRAVYGKVTLRY
ncbi:MAG: TonB-dependent receptor [Verrucomicrobia bacterium]|nr:TonB-dependent receptor [Verrucomicrobiota bacterium]